MGWREASMMRRQVLSVRGQLSGGPKGVAAQLKARMAAPISPPPERNSGMDQGLGDMTWMTLMSGGCPYPLSALPASTPQPMQGSKFAELSGRLGAYLGTRNGPRGYFLTLLKVPEGAA